MFCFGLVLKDNLERLDTVKKYLTEILFIMLLKQLNLKLTLHCFLNRILQQKPGSETCLLFPFFQAD